jgi:hypothetical protein
LNAIRWALVLLLLSPLLGAPARADDTVAQGAPDADGWSLVRDDHTRDIRAYARQEDGKPQRSFRVDATIAGKPEDLAAVLLDFENYPKWFWNVREAHLLKKVAATEYYIYVVYQAPYPLANRDCILHARATPQSRNDKRFILSVSAAPGYLPPQPGLVRMPANQFTVVFSPEPDGRIETHVNGYMESGGEVPLWAADFVQQAAPYYTVRGLQRMTENPAGASKQPLPFPIYSYDEFIKLDKVASR